MNIQSPVNINRTPVFTAWIHGANETLNDKTNSISNRNDTVFFRKDLDFPKLVSFLDEKYEDVSKVNVYNYACSDCSEPYSLAMCLDSKLGKKANKFYPIMARDFDLNALTKATKSPYSLSYGEIERIKSNTNDEFSKYLDIDWNHVSATNNHYFVSDDLKSKVDIAYGDLLKDYKNIEPENSVILVRNVWPYINKNDREGIVKYWSDNLAPSSSIIIGSFDSAVLSNDEYSKNIRTLLKKYNFVETDVPNVFQKNKEFELPDYVTNRDLVNYSKKQ